MTDIKMFPMGFGESILLGSDNECLLVDCGSESYSRNLYFDRVCNELDQYNRKSAMISHFHEDHINGFIEMVKKNRCRFETVYIPDVFTFIHPNFIDMEIIKVILEEISCPHEKSLSLWDFLNILCENGNNIKPLKRRRKAFCETGEDFDVLWPVPEKVVSKRLYNKLKVKLTGEIIEQVESLSDYICQRFVDFGNETILNDFGEINNEIEERLFGINETVIKQETNYLLKDEANEFLKAIRGDANRTSIVFQSSSDDSKNKNILLTGDIPNGTMKKIAENELVPRIKLKKHFYAIKVPHHGTDNHYFNFGCYTLFENLFISNGETNMKNRGKISKKYNLLSRDYNITCTNCCDSRCQCFCGQPKLLCSNSSDNCNCNNGVYNI